MKRMAEYARNAAPGFIGGFLGVALTASVAEYIRLEIQKDGYPTPVEKVFAMEKSTYHQFPIEWKQLLAQVAMEPQMYTGHTVQFLSTLSVKQAALIDKVSAHVLGGDFLVRDNNNASKHHIAGVTLHDFLNLEALRLSPDCCDWFKYDDRQQHTRELQKRNPHKKSCTEHRAK